MDDGTLAIDVSNTHTSLGLWRGSEHPLAWKIASDPARTADEHRVLITQLLERDGVAPQDVSSCVIGCVVPELAGTVEQVCRELFDVEPLVVRPGVHSGLPIRTDNPRELGADRIANAVAARERFGAPVIVLDFSTALTLDVVGPDGAYVGAVIAPGLGIAAEALSRRAARIGSTELVAPPSAIGRDTDHGLQSGLVFGYVGLIEGLVRRVREEIGADAPVVATGDEHWLQALLGQTDVIDAYEPLLTLDGLRRIHERHTAADRGTERAPAG
ncbi:MAG: type III pantothenate kinase [Anaerolineae bacterium]|jgi:type III pantothenate kinase